MPKIKLSPDANYVSKSYPITLQDIIELVQSKHLDPKNLMLIINDSNPNFTGYVEEALLNTDGSGISIELYTACTKTHFQNN